MGDGDELRLGDSADLQLYHASSNSHIKNDTNALIIRSDALRCNNNANSATMIKADAGSGVELYHDNSVRAETISSGFKVSRSVDDSSTTLKLENNSTHNSQNPSVSIKVDLANAKNGGSIDFIRENNYQSSAASDSSIVFKPAKNDTPLEIVKITQDYVRLHSNSSGIQFNSDTADANALNDYEEGTYTPVVGAAGWNATSGEADGTYIKVGDIVTVHIRYESSSFSSVGMSDALYVTLPFTSKSGGNTKGTLMCSEWSIGSQSISWIGADVRANTDNALFHYHNGNNNNTNNLTKTSANDQLNFKGTVVYQTST